MKKYFSFLFCFLSLAAVASAQPKTKAPIKSNVPALQKLLTGTALPFTMVNDTLAAIPYGGENITSYQVVVQKVGDLYIIYTNLSEALPGKINDTKYKYLLQQNDHFDIIKVGMSADDNTVYVRADIYKASATTPILTRIIKQVANVTNIIGGELKQ
ncbi:MAG: hypothetical protein JWR72_106 [Flavisolibacter sp.]|jgi:hypothetical protein|nr:hypothetical protein [Flavisolibacter sp.]